MPLSQKPPSSLPAPSEIPPARDIEAVYDALCLAGAPRGKSWVSSMLKAMDHRSERGARLTPEELAAALAVLLAAGRIVASPGVGFIADVRGAGERFAELMQRPQARHYWRWWVWASSGSNGPLDGDVHWVRFHSRDDMPAVLRLVLYSGIDLPAFGQLIEGPLSGAATVPSFIAALTQPPQPQLLERMEIRLRAYIGDLLASAIGPFSVTQQPLLDWMEASVRRQPTQWAALVRHTIADRLMHSGELAAVPLVLAGLDDPMTRLFAAAQLAFAGQWQQAAAAYAAAYKAQQAAAGKRKGVAATSLLWMYPLSLLAQPDASAWSAAYKFCAAEAGSRKPSPFSVWGLWAHAAAVRLGDEPLRPEAFEHPAFDMPTAEALHLAAMQLVLAAWLGVKPDRWTRERVAAVVLGLEGVHCRWLAALARHACERIGWPAPEATPLPPQLQAPARFHSAPREAWRDALAAITALGDGQAPNAAAAQPAGTLVWSLSLDSEARVVGVTPFERSGGARQPGKLKSITLSKVKASTTLDARDAAVARNIERSRWSARQMKLDVVGAALALLKHPAVMFDDAPGQWVELAEALPQLEVTRREVPGGDRFVFRIDPPLQAAKPPLLGAEWDYADDEDKEIERRNGLRIVRDAPDRARLIRVTAAQRRVAELVSQDWSVPVDAKEELDTALRVLSAHFQLHSDATAGQEVPGESRLRAQLTPVGDGLQLRLVVMPFGSFGPAVAPGVGRARLMTLHEGVSLATQRHLDTENAHLQSVLEALPFLHDEEPAEPSWLLEDPELALRSVELLPTLPAVAGLDWPRGKPMRVTPVASDAIAVKVHTTRDWFGLEGELQLDDARVIGLQHLMQLARESRGGRFVALGEGEYLALTDRLRQQLADLQAVAAAGKKGLELPAAAAAWLEETLDGMQVAGDKPWAQRIAALGEAAELVPEVPRSLRAELRSYQAEGFAWMARLAHAGLGACLADDMGLGKTVQTLALLLARAEGGPALVIAPTSVCANWVAEAASFAPSLKVGLYGEGDREHLVESARAFDLVVVSYALVQIHTERFAAKHWHTLVLDEAQAVKNAATKRAKSVTGLRAGFRLALTGTPVENHLGDLWSLMNLLNPGLLGSAHQFNERFATPIERQRDAGARTRLRRLMSPFLLRRTKAQVLSDLPPRTEIVHRIEPSEGERSFLEALRRSAASKVEALEAQGDSQAGFHVLAELTRLRRAACDPRLVAPELGIVGAKSQEFEQLVRELVEGQHKALVFSQFTDFLKLLAAQLDEAKISYQYLDGSTPAAERGKRVAAFQRGEGDLFLISLKAGGFGLNLTMADYVLIVDPWWNPAAEDQAMGRAHRIGQQRPVTVYRLVTAGSIEEKIVALHHDKRGLAEGILEGQDQGKAIGAEELRALLRG
jgi:superfamily II DNA or RNA helicase